MKTPQKSDQGTKLTSRFGTCSKDCYGSCVYTGFWEDDAPEIKLKKALPRRDHPFTQGVFCPKYTERSNLLYHPSRLKGPLLRQTRKPSNAHMPITFERAWETLLAKLKAMYTHYGPESIICAYNAGNSGFLSQYSPLKFFMQIGAQISQGGLCNKGGCVGLEKMFGTYSLTNPFQMVRPETKMIVVWNSDLGNNNNHADLLVRKAQKRGTKLVVIDSRKTTVAARADLFVPIQLNTSHLLALLICQRILQENIQNTAFLAEHAENFEQISDILKGMDTSAFIPKIGIKEKTFEALYSFYKEYTGSTVSLIGYGTQKDRYGGHYVQMIALTAVLLGNLGQPGAGVVYSQSDYRRDLRAKMKATITQNFPDVYPNYYDIIRLGEIIQSDKPQMLFIYNFNPASSLPHQSQLRRLLQRENLYTVCFEIFLNETTAFADLVFPMKMAAETDDLVLSYYIPGISSIQGGPCPYPNCLSAHELFSQLGEDFGNSINVPFGKRANFAASSRDIIAQCVSALPPAWKKNLLADGYALFVDEGTIFFPESKYPTPDHRIQLSPLLDFINQVYFEVNHVKSDIPGEFWLYTPNHPRLLHSQLGELNAKFTSDFAKVFIHPADAQKLGLIEGEDVIVSNQNHTSSYKLDISADLHRRVAMIYSGGYFRGLNQSNANFFTGAEPEVLGKSGAFFGSTVKIERKKGV